MRKLIITILMITIISVSGCTNISNVQINNNSTTTLVEDIQLSNEEKELLKNIYIDDDRIDSGKLYSYQKETVEQYRFAMEYLNNKYPSYEFKITYCSPMNKTSIYNQMFFTEKSLDGTFEIDIRYQNDKLVAEDNFYGKLIEDDYNKLIEDYLPKDIGIVNIDSIISSIKDESFNENLKAIDLINDDNFKVSVMTTICILNTEMDENTWDNIISSIESILLDKDIYGNYIIACFKSLDDIDNFDYTYKYTFNTYN